MSTLKIKQNGEWIEVGSAASTEGPPGPAGLDGKSAYKSAQDGGYNKSEEQFNADLAKVSDKANVPAYVLYTMVATNWVDNTYSFEAYYPHAQYDISIEASNTATAEQFEAFGEAMICGSAESNVATAINGAPSMDIPVIIKAVVK
jgi:hypothetical protein